MKQGQQFLLLRYGNNIVPDTIQRHQEIIERLGYCWFGKIGVVPSAKIRKAIMEEEDPRIILYTKDVAHECQLLEITVNKPSEGYPAYYDTEGVFPNVYFKLGSMTPVEMKELSRYRVISSGSSLWDALWHSMTSYFFAEWPEKPGSISRKKRAVSVGRKEEKDLLPVNDCVYRKNGICSNKRCISYKYECDRPSMCLKQKR